MTSKNAPSRRDFLKSGTAMAAGIALAGGLNVARTAHAAGGDELKLALVGCGSRGTAAAYDNLSSCDNVKLIAVADAFTVTAGCDKRFVTCRDTFDNVVNFRGFPHIPGNDFVARYAVAGEPGHAGKSLQG